MHKQKKKAKNHCIPEGIYASEGPMATWFIKDDSELCSKNSNIESTKAWLTWLGSCTQVFVHYFFWAFFLAMCAIGTCVHTVSSRRVLLLNSIVCLNWRVLKSFAGCGPWVSPPKKNTIFSFLTSAFFKKKKEVSIRCRSLTELKLLHVFHWKFKQFIHQFYMKNLSASAV